MPIDSFQLCFGFVILDSLVWGENCNIGHLAYSAMAQLVLGRALKEQPGLLTQVILDEQGVSRHDGVIFFTWSFVNDWFLLEPHMSPSRGWGEPLLPPLHLPWRRRGGKQGTAMAGLWLSPPWASARQQQWHRHQRRISALHFLLLLCFWKEELLWQSPLLGAIRSLSLLLRAWGPHAGLGGGPPSAVCWSKSIWFSLGHS